MGRTRDLRHHAARGSYSPAVHGAAPVTVGAVARHHAVTVPSAVPVGLRREHSGGALRCPSRLAYDRGERAACPLAVYLSTATVRAAAALAAGDPRAVLAAAGIGRSASVQRAMIRRAARGVPV